MTRQPISNLTNPQTLLVVIASDSDRSAKNTAMSRLADLASDSDEAWEALLAVCHAHDPAVRCHAAHLSARIEELSSALKRREQLSQLILSLLGDDDESVRDTAVSHFIYLPEGERQTLCRAAISALEHRVQKNTEDDGLLFEFRKLVEGCKDPQLVREALVLRFIELLHGAEHGRVRARAAELLYPRDAVPDVTDVIVPALTAALCDTDASVQRQAALTLGEFGPHAESAMPRLVTLVEGGSEAAAYALGRIGPAATVAVPALCKAVQRKRLAPYAPPSSSLLPSELWPVRHAAMALVMLDAHLGAPLALITRALLLHLACNAGETDSRASEAERLAAAALERCGPACQAAVPALVDGLRHASPVRPYAARALVRLQPPPEQVVPALQTLLHGHCQTQNELHGDADYTYGIAWALEHIVSQGRKRHNAPS